MRIRRLHRIGVRNTPFIFLKTGEELRRPTVYTMSGKRIWDIVDPKLVSITADFPFVIEDATAEFGKWRHGDNMLVVCTMSVSELQRRFGCSRYQAQRKLDELGEAIFQTGMAI